MFLIYLLTFLPFLFLSSLFFVFVLCSISVLKDSSLTLPMIKVFEKFDRAQSSFTQNVLEKLILETRELGTRTEVLALSSPLLSPAPPPFFSFSLFLPSAR